MKNVRRLVPLLILTLTSCGDDPTGPVEDPTMTVSPVQQWAGGTVQATSETFGAVPFAILVDGDTLEVTSSGGSTVDVVLPNPRLTGPATLELHVDGAAVSTATVQVVGAVREPLTIECDTSIPQPCQPQLEADAVSPKLEADPLSYHGSGIPSGRLLAYLSFIADEADVGFAIADLDADLPTATLIPGLDLDRTQAGISGLVAPGLAALPDSRLLEASASDSAAPPVRWTFTAGGDAGDTLTCLADGFEGGYMVAELPTGDCLVLGSAAPSESARLMINGTTTIAGYGTIARPWRAGCVGFRGATGNSWVTLRSLEGTFFCENVSNEVPPAWPVLASDGSVGFTSDRYPEWPKGVDFTPGGDTLWVIGETTQAEWSLDAWDSASGQLILEVSLDGAEACWDLRVDVLTPRVYVACRFTDVPPGSDEDWPSLLVYDRQAGAVAAVLHPLEQPFDWPVLPPFELVHSVAEGFVHLTAVWDGTSAPVDRGLMVASWDVF